MKAAGNWWHTDRKWNKKRILFFPLYGALFAEYSIDQLFITNKTQAFQTKVLIVTINHYLCCDWASEGLVKPGHWWTRHDQNSQLKCIQEPQERPASYKLREHPAWTFSWILVAVSAWVGRVLLWAKLWWGCRTQVNFSDQHWAEKHGWAAWRWYSSP